MNGGINLERGHSCPLGCSDLGCEADRNVPKGHTIHAPYWVVFVGRGY